MALGLGLFAVAMIVALVLGRKAANNSRKWDEARHISLIKAAGNGKAAGR